MGKNGFVKVSKDVILKIIGVATLEVEGVANLNGFNPDLVSQAYLPNDLKGIGLEIIGNDLYINLSINIHAAYEIPKVCTEIQENVTKELKTMTGLDAKEVNIEVLDIVD